ncbi:hypothetical protein [Fodinicurvata halophila]|uniref:hypothetical protein n=1 Tax=Fodinicurvata halophila TaxID=1419723 RepID=UPI00363D25B0
MKKQIATTGQRPGFTRRQVMKSAAAGAAVLAAPAIISPRALSSSGEVRVYCWAGYFSDDMLADFTDKTGIEVTRVEFGSNEEQMNQVRANQASGFDLIMPTIDRVPQYVEEGFSRRSTQTISTSTRSLPAT